MDLEERSTSMTGHSSQRRDIQFLRAFAVLAVIAYHFQIPNFAGGFVGVDVFFVISGYLIFGQVNGQLVRGDFSLTRFLEARLRRIFPALALMCLATLAAGWLLTLPRDYVSQSRTALSALAFVSNLAFIGRDYFDAASHTEPLLHTWSLSIEGQFYFWLPLLLIAIVKARHAAKVPHLLVLAAAASLGWAIWLSLATGQAGFYHVLARAWEFLAGALCALLPRRQSRTAGPLLGLSLIGLVLSVVLLRESTPWPGLWTLVPVGCAAVFVSFGAAGSDHPVVAHRGGQLVGDMSYSLYLWHWPIWVFAGQVRAAPPSLPGKLSLLTLTFALASISWRWVERPFRERGQVTAERLKAVTIGALLCGASVTVFAVVTKGYPQRFPAYIGRAAIQAAQTTPRRECFRSDRNTKSAPEQFCAYGASAHPEQATAMLWGDSHANQYISALSDAAATLGQTGLIATMGGCRAFIETDAVQHPDFPWCKDFNREVYAYLVAHPEIRTVILGRIWANSDESIGRTVALVRDLIARGRSVILIAPLPDPGMNVETTWAMKQIRAGHAIDDIPLPGTADVRQSPVLDKLQAGLKRDYEGGRLRLLDPSPRLCDPAHCYAVRNGWAYFRDDSHLTEAAARLFEPDFLEALRSSAAAPAEPHRDALDAQQFH